MSVQRGRETPGISDIRGEYRRGQRQRHCAHVKATAGNVHDEINRRSSQMRKISKNGKAKKRERADPSARSKVDHVFRAVKGQVKFKKTRYLELQK